MPLGNKLKTRLTLWSILFLTIILGGGGFFTYLTLERQLVSDLDKHLLTVARDFSLASQTAVEEASKASLCQFLTRYSERHNAEFAIVLYSAEGQPLCRTSHPLSAQLNAPGQDILASESLSSLQLRYNTNPVASYRTLLYPVVKEGKNRLFMQIGSPLEDIEQQLRTLALLLIATWALAVVGLIPLQSFMISLLTNPLEQLRRHFEKTDEDTLQQHFEPPPPATAELHQLSRSYNDLASRISRNLQKARQFSADVTHELRTPLTILRGETELALRGDKDKEILRQTLSSSLEEINRMGQLIDDLLMLSKSELGEIPLKMEALNLSNLLEELHIQAKIIAEKKDIQVNLEAGPEQVSLYADGLRLRQAFLNLLSNAIKYTPEGGTVSINASLQGDMARILVEDTGIGIDSTHQEHIFDRFYRIDKTGNRADGGSGLGLAIVKWIIDAHDGAIMVCSTPGQGSCFSVTLPVTRLQNHPGPLAE